MPSLTYQRVEDLPKDVRECLSIELQQLFLTTYNQLLERGCDWGSAFQIAWARLGVNNQ
jgi:cation transport regulator ChaB